MLLIKTMISSDNTRKELLLEKPLLKSSRSLSGKKSLMRLLILMKEIKKKVINLLTMQSTKDLLMKSLIEPLRTHLRNHAKRLQVGQLIIT